MKILIKWYYGYKNFGDEVILLSLLRWVEQALHPEQIFISAGNKDRLEHRIISHKKLVPTGILDKIEVLEKSKAIDHVRNICWINQNWDFIVFWGGQVVDEERKFPHDGRNLPLLYKRYINTGKFALIGGLGTQNKEGTALLHKILLERAKIVLLREHFSTGIAEKILNVSSSDKTLQNEAETYPKKLKMVGDLSIPILKEFLNNAEKQQPPHDPYVLINLSPAVDLNTSIKKIKIFLTKYPKAHPIFFPAHLSEDLPLGKRLQEDIPSLEIIDWTSMGLDQALKLFYFAEAGIGERLHFLSTLKLFEKEYEVLEMSHKIQVNLLELW